MWFMLREYGRYICLEKFPLKKERSLQELRVAGNCA